LALGRREIVKVYKTPPNSDDDADLNAFSSITIPSLNDEYPSTMPDGPYPWSMYIHQWTRLPAAPRENQLAGQTVIITGANSGSSSPSPRSPHWRHLGLGLEVTRQLAALHPAKLILAVRTLDTGEKALATLKKKFPKLDAEVWFLDLMDIKSIKAFVERAQGLGRLDVLLNNAGWGVSILL